MITEAIEKIPDTFPGQRRSNGFCVENFMQEHEDRRKWMDKGMFAFVSWEWVNPFAAWIGSRKVLEVMAGRGWLAKALREKGIDIIATDNYSWYKMDGNKWEPPVTEVEKLNAKNAIIKYGSGIDLFIISWPYMDDHAYNSIRFLYKLNPRALIVYIGEGEGGCTANDKFFDHFSEIQDEKFEIAASKFSSWDGIHDRLELGKYKP